MLEKRIDKNSRQGRGSETFRSYAKWSGLAFQMAALVVAGLFAGRLADRLLERDDSLMTLTGVVAGVIAAMVFAIRSIIRTGSKKQE